MTPISNREIRIYLCASAVDMAQERALLRERVRPELERRLALPGLAISWVDPEGDPGSTQDLAARFREIDLSRPFFVGLLGERDGGGLESIDAALLYLHPWLRGRESCSLQEIETTYALTQGDRAPRSFFYLRDPAFLDQVPEPLRSTYRPAISVEAQRVASFREELRRSQRPLFDGYPCRWDGERGQLSGFDSLVERLISDLEGAIRTHLGLLADGGVETPATPRLPTGPAAPLVVHEDVQFTVYRPRVVEPLKWETLVAFAHLTDRPIDSLPDEPDPLEEVKRRAERLLGTRAGLFVEVRQDSAFAIPDEAEITFIPMVPGCDFNPPRCTFLWYESVHQEEFRLRAHPILDGKVAQGRFSIFWGSLLLAEIQLNIKVDSRSATAHSASQAAMATRPFGSIFASYSHRDSFVVEEMERAARILGHRYLRDVHDLRAGEVWGQQLETMIQQADIFQLFWSWNALQSPYVEHEWRYALSLSRSNFVRPTYWEEPLPSDLQRNLPPSELMSLHFERLQLGSTGAVAAGAHGVVPAQAEVASPAPPPPSPVALPPSAPSPATPAQDARLPSSRSYRWLGLVGLFLTAVVGLSLFIMQSGFYKGSPYKSTSADHRPEPQSAPSEVLSGPSTPHSPVSKPSMASQEPSVSSIGKPHPSGLPRAADPVPSSVPQSLPLPSDSAPTEPAPSRPASTDPAPDPRPAPVDLSELWAKAVAIARQDQGEIQVAVIFHNNAEVPFEGKFDSAGTALRDNLGQRYPLLRSDLSSSGSEWRLHLVGGGSATAHFYFPMPRPGSTAFFVDLPTADGQRLKLFGLPLALEGAP